MEDNNVQSQVIKYLVSSIITDVNKLIHECEVINAQLILAETTTYIAQTKWDNYEKLEKGEVMYKHVSLKQKAYDPDVADEKRILDKWIKDMKMSPERFMRESSAPDDTYDISDSFDTIHGYCRGISKTKLKEMNSPRKEKARVIGSLRKYSKTTINLDKLMSDMARLNEIRDIVRNNTWGVYIGEAELDKYPEIKELHSLKSILLEGIMKQESYWKQRYLMIWSCAPEDSILAKTWNLLESLNYDENNREILWQKDLQSFNKKEVIIKEDKEFWFGLYENRFITYDHIISPNIKYNTNCHEIKISWSHLNERRIGKEFEFVA